MLPVDYFFRDTARQGVKLLPKVGHQCFGTDVFQGVGNLYVVCRHQPAIVFLDEPTGGVDPITRRQFWELIYEAAAAGTTVLVTTHYMDEAEYCDRVSIMVSGALAALGTPAELKAQWGAASIDDLFVRLARPA